MCGKIDRKIVVSSDLVQESAEINLISFGSRLYLQSVLSQNRGQNELEQFLLMCIFERI